MKFLTRITGIGLLLLLAACNQQGAGEAGGGQAPAQVSVMAAKLLDAPVSFEYTGQVNGSNEVEIRARVTGIIDKRLYEEGSAVKAGQTLFQLDDAMFKAQAAQAEAALASARAQLQKAERDYARVAPLSSKQLLSQSQRDDAESAVDIAKAAVMQAQASLDSARINLGYTTIKSPINGVAGRASQREGSLVQAGGDSLLTTVAQTDPAYVDFGMAEGDFQNLRQALSSGKLTLPEGGFTVVLKTPAGAPLEQTGQMNFQDYKVDAQTGNVAMRATIENPKRRLLPGQFVRVMLQGAHRPNAIVVPQQAVLDNPQGKYVYVMSKNEQGMDVALPHPVEAGEWVQMDGDLANGWILNSGIKEGDQVIVDGMARIFFPGMPVQVGAPEAAKPEHAAADTPPATKGEKTEPAAAKPEPPAADTKPAGNGE